MIRSISIRTSSCTVKPAPSTRAAVLAGLLSIAAGATAFPAADLTGWGRQTIPSAEELDSLQTIVAGGAFNAGLRTDGSIVVWGANNFRQGFVPADLEEAVQIAAGASHVLALQRDGSVIGWGNNRHGQASPPRDLGPAVFVAAGHSHSLALLADGSVTAWGDNRHGQSDVPENLANVRSLAAGETHSLALLEDGTVFAWGSGAAVPLPEDMPPLRQIASGLNHNVGLTADGGVVAWGAEDHGQTGVPRGLRGIASVAAGGDHSLALRENGTIIAWGRNDHGQGTVPRETGRATLIAAGHRHNLALTTEGPVAWGGNEFGQSLTARAVADAVQISARGQHGIALMADGSVLTWGEQPTGMSIPKPAGLGEVTAVTAGGNHFLALRRNGTVAAWGDNSFRQLDGAEDLQGIIAIAAGEYHNLALRHDGRVVSWGSIIEAQQVPSGLTDVIAVAAGPFHSLALRSNGTVRAWGNNFYGETSVPSGLRDVTAIAAGDFHSLALRRNGTVVAWGSDFFGQSSPPSGLDSVTAIAAGSTHNLALRTDGSVVAWGSDFYGQSTVRDNLSNTIAIAAGGSHSLAISGEPTPPRIFAQSGPSVVDAGQTAVFNVFASGSPPLQFQWTHNDQPIPNANRQSLIVENAASGDAGRYKALIASPTGNVVSDIFALEVRDPAISRHPNSRSVRLGGPVILRADAAGTEPFRFQWKIDGEPISGATERVLEITNIRVDQTGAYTVEVTNEHGSAESRPGHVIAVPEFVRQPPELVPGVVGEPLTVRAEATGSPPLSYQWEFGETLVPGATEAELTIPAVRLEHEGTYRVTVWNNAGSVTSRSSRLSIAPVIALQPQSQVLPLGGTAIFEIRAIGSEPIRYRWRHGGDIIQDGPSNQLVRENISARDGGTYTVEAVNEAGSQISREARLIAPPGILRHPESKEVRAGETVRFHIEAIGAEPIRFQWEKDREPIPGATASSLTLENTRGDDGGSYRVRVINEAGEIVSRAAILRLAPRIVAGPDSADARPGQRVRFQVEAEGTPPLSYQWMRDGVPLDHARGPILEIPAVNETDSGNYTVMVSNAAGIQLSEPVQLSLLNQ